MSFKPAVRTKLKARIALCGPTGGGKTFTAERISHLLSLADGGRGRIAVIDSEHRRASKYLGESPDGWPFAFDVDDITDYSPESYISSILLAGRSGYDVLIIDSLSHAWAGDGGVLSIVDQKTSASRSKNAYTEGWRHATPMHNKLVHTILHSPCHIIACMRSKMDYDLIAGDGGGKIPVKIGMEPIQRNDIEYEFDIVGDFDQSHTMRVTKGPAGIEGKSFVKPGPDFIEPIISWLAVGSEAPEGYYAVTEEDLAASEAARREAEKLKPKVAKPKKTKAELLAQGAQAAAVVGGAMDSIVEAATNDRGTATAPDGSTATAAPIASSITPTVDPTGAHAPLPASDRLAWTVDRAKAETAKLRPSAEEVAAAASTSTEPGGPGPSATADKPATAVSSDPGGSNGRATSTIDVPFDPVASGHEESLSVPCDESQQNHIYSLLERIRGGVSDEDFADWMKRFKSQLKSQCKASKISELTKKQAIAVMEGLRAIEAGQHLANRIDEKNGMAEPAAAAAEKKGAPTRRGAPVMESDIPY